MSWTSAAVPGSTFIAWHASGTAVTASTIRQPPSDHARSTAARKQFDCHFVQADLRHATFGEGFDLVLLIYGQIG